MREEDALISFLLEYVDVFDKTAPKSEIISSALNLLIDMGVFTESEISIEIYRMSGIYISAKRIRAMSNGTVLFFYPPIKKRRNHNG